MPQSPGLARIAPIALPALFFVILAVPRAEAVDPALRLYADTFPPRTLERVRLGTVALAPLPLTSLTQEGYPDAVALEAAARWTFLPPGGPEVVTQTAPVDPAWSCYVPSGCGGALGPTLSDRLFTTDRLGTPALRAMAALGWNGTDTLYLRGQIDDEGGTDETRVCTGMTDVPWLVFPNTDGTRRYLAEGDAPWVSAPILCGDGLTQAGPCNTPGTTIYLGSGNGTTGTFEGRVVRSGTLTLPSGHVLDGFLVEQYASFLGHLNRGPAGCSVPVARLRLYRLLWIVPEVGVVAEVTSPDDTGSLATFTTAEDLTIDYGLLPPVSIRVDALGAGSITVSWDPGRLGANPPDSYTVHWGLQPGSQSPPVGSATTSLRSHTISGLTAGTRYWVSVSSNKSYTDPVSGVVTMYGSVALPVSIGADIDGDGNRDTSYPPEVSAVPVAVPVVNLLRDDTIPPGGRPTNLGSHFPLDPLNPYLRAIVPGTEDPEQGVLADTNRPFVLYAIDPPTSTILLMKSSGAVRVDYF